MEIPNEIIGKIMLFNSHPVADVMRSEIDWWKAYRERVQKHREEFNKKYIVSDDSDDEPILLNVKQDEFNFNDMFFSMSMKQTIFNHNWSKFDKMVEMSNKLNIKMADMYDEDYDLEYQY